jgi:hypothetical protein
MQVRIDSYSSLKNKVDSSSPNRPKNKVDSSSPNRPKTQPRYYFDYWTVKEWQHTLAYQDMDDGHERILRENNSSKKKDNMSENDEENDNENKRRLV